MRQEGILKITLQSDLCISSGYSYAGLIDSDICYDQYGLPYIPGRRLKGCLRQSAEEVLEGTVLSKEDIKAIFGEGGNGSIKDICVSNAKLANANNVIRELKALQDNSLISADNILDQYSHVQGQTKLKDGVAEKETLRYTRVINEHSPIDGKALVFEAQISIASDDQKVEKQLEMIAKATRNIGLKRNRGLGSVACEITDWKCIDENKDVVKNAEALITSDADPCVLEFIIKNEDPLMLSMKSDNETIKYIPGQALLGLLANCYLKGQGHSAEDEAFFDLFLNGTTKYCNLMPVKNDRIYYPAPSYINKLKKSKKYVNTLLAYEGKEGAVDDIDYCQALGNQPKKLKGSFVYVDDQMKIDETEVKTQMVYHNSHREAFYNEEDVSSGDKKAGGLYYLEVVEEGQEFIGQIYTTKKYAPIIESLLHNNLISFGKSKSAQYGRCKLQGDIQQKTNPAKKAYTDTIVVTFLSDAVFLNDKGEYTVYDDEVKKIVAKSLGIDSYISDNDQNPALIGKYATKEIVGFQSKWNLRKMPIPAIEAGSCILYQLPETVELSAGFVGEKNVEGYGLIRIDCLNAMAYKVGECPLAENATDQGIDSAKASKQLLKNILIADLLARLNAEHISIAKFEKEKNSLNSSAVGRITLMLTESLNSSKDADLQKDDFKKRINSIKTNDTRSKAKNIYNSVANLKIVGAAECGNMEKAVTKIELTEDEKSLADFIGISLEALEKELNKHWGQYAMTVLIMKKYMNATEE